MVTDSDRVIPPGKEGSATLEVNTVSQAGQMAKSATLYTNDPDRPSIVFVLTANVLKGAPLRRGKHIGPVFLSPESPAAMFAYPGKKATARFSVTADNDPVKVLRVEGATKRFVSRIETVEPGRNYNIVVESISAQTSGLYTDQLRIVTDNPALPGFPIKLSLKVF